MTTPPHDPADPGDPVDRRDDADENAAAGGVADDPPSASPSRSEPDAGGPAEVARDQGPGCLPAIVAATVLVGVVGFITCGVTTWMLFQKRTELAIRTLENTYVPQVEQSHLRPDEKQAIVEQLEAVSADLRRGRYENWQAAGVMQRLVRLPVIQWGELHVVESFLRRQDAGDAGDALRQLSRLRRAVELGHTTTVDLDHVLDPVITTDDSGQRSLQRPLEETSVAEVVERAERVADRSNVPDRRFDQVRIERIVRREIEQGITEGSY